MEGQVQHLFTACSKGYGYGQTSVKACTTVNIDTFSAHVLKLPRILGRRFADAYDLRVSLVS